MNLTLEKMIEFAVSLEENGDNPAQMRGYMGELRQVALMERAENVMPYSCRRCHGSGRNGVRHKPDCLLIHPLVKAALEASNAVD